MLGQYLETQIGRGVVRALSNPELAAQAFFGTLFEFAISGQLWPDSPPDAQQEVVSQCADIFVRGTTEQREERR
jgi:hypothetical protein